MTDNRAAPGGGAPTDPSDAANRAAAATYAKLAGAAETVPMYHALRAAYAVDFAAADYLEGIAHTAAVYEQGKRDGRAGAMAASPGPAAPDARRQAFAEALARWRDPRADSMEFDDWLEAAAAGAAPADQAAGREGDTERLHSANVTAGLLGGAAPATPAVREAAERAWKSWDGTGSAGFYKAMNDLAAALAADTHAAPADQAIYVTFSETERGTKVRATRGYNGPVIAALQWERRLSGREQVEINTGIRSAYE